MALTELASKRVNADFIKPTLQFALQWLTEMDVDAPCKAAYGERSEESVNSHADKGRHQTLLPLIKTIFAQDTPEVGSAQPRIVTDQLRAKLPKLADMMKTTAYPRRLKRHERPAPFLGAGKATRRQLVSGGSVGQKNSVSAG
jgi:hypothetical protein